MHKTTKNLQKFYDTEAEKFSGTRKRNRPEFAYIRDMIKEVFPHRKSLRILELGCGDGRLLDYLGKELPITYDYT
jgi:2-polyprenyl-3-methyl-5-hydroxy-6-metoxy-1,4-benzoquinol methylase